MSKRLKLRTLPFLFIVAVWTSSSFAQTRRVYQGPQLEIEQIAPHTFIHISYLNTDDYGRVACNGMIIVNSGEAVIFDTPVSDEAALELIDWIRNTRHSGIKAVIPTHFHYDCLGSLSLFQKQGIPSFGNKRTIELAQEVPYPVPEKEFKDSLKLELGSDNVFVYFPGEGHTPDNVIGYYPVDQVLFGGCLVKTLGAGKGNLADANVDAWPGTMNNLLKKYANVTTIVPGHGKPGGQELLNYTMDLFQKSP